MKKSLLLSVFLVVVTVVLGFASQVNIAHAVCRIDDPGGGAGFEPVIVPVTASIDSADVNGNSLNIQVSGLPGFVITACGGSVTKIPPVSISASIGGATASASIPSPSIDGYSANFTVDVSSLSPGTYTLQVIAKSIGTDTATTPINIPYVIRRTLPPASGGTATFSQTTFGIGDSYSFSVSSAPASTVGDLYASTDGGNTWVETGGWINTDVNGNATKGPWICSSPNNTSVYIKWPTKGTQTNTASYVCLPDPVVSLTSSPSQINRSMGDPVTISWSSSNTSQCTGTIDVGDGNPINIGGTSGSYTVPAEQLTLNNTLLDGHSPPGVGSPLSAPINSSIICQNSVGRSASKSASTSVFYNTVSWVGLKEPSCGAVKSAVPLSSAEAQQVTLSEEIDNNQTNEVAKGPYPNIQLTPYKPDNRVWGWGEPMRFKVSQDTSGNYIVTPPSGYIYCGTDQEPYITPDAWPNITPYAGNVNLYFAPVGGGVPGTPTNFAAGGECRQNYPDTQTQNFLGWSPVSGADSYNIYRDGTFLANTVNTWYMDIFSPAKYNESHSYYVAAKNSSGESAKTSTYTATTPASCTGDPPQPPPGSSPGYLIDPPQQTINVGDNAQYRGLYDPDGNNIRFGNFNVASLASWSVVHSNIAQSLSGGKYLGKTSGSTGIGSIYRNITANATLNVQNVSSPDFSISINPATPQYNSVIKPGTATYAVTISPISGFNSNVILSVDNLKSGTTGTFSPTSVNTSGNSTLTLSVTASSVDERYTFTVMGQSGSISHSATADLVIQSPAPPEGGLTCSLSADTNSPPNISFQSITGGSGGYVCNFPSQEQSGFPIYSAANCTNPYPSGCTVQGTCTINASVFDNSGKVPHNSTSCSITVNGSGPGTGPSLQMYIQDGTNGGTGPTYGLVNNLYPGGFGATYYTQDGSITIPPIIVPYSYPFNSYPIKLSWKASNIDPNSCSATSTTQIVNWSGTKDPNSNGEIDYVQVPNPGKTVHNEPELDCGSGNSGIGRSMLAYIYRCAENDTSKYSSTCQAITPSGCTFTSSPSAVLYGQSSTLSWDCTPTDTSRTCTITKVSDGSAVTTGTQSGSVKVKPTQSTTYNLHCDKNPTVQDTTAAVDVGFLPVIREIIPR